MTEWSGKGYPIGILTYISIFSSSSYPWLEISRVSILCPAQLFLGVDMILVEIKQTRIPFVKTGVDIDNNNIVWVTQKGELNFNLSSFFFLVVVWKLTSPQTFYCQSEIYIRLVQITALLLLLLFLMASCFLSLQSAFLFVWLTGWISTPSVFFFSPCPLAIPIQPYTINKPIKGEEEENPSSCFVMLIRQTHGISLWLLASSFSKVIVFNERKQHFWTDLCVHYFIIIQLVFRICYWPPTPGCLWRWWITFHGQKCAAAKIHSLIPLKGVIHAGHCDNDGAPYVANLGELM